MKVYVFDLDDTLYEEITYVRSGFRSVARDLQVNYGIAEQEAYERMLQVLEREGRGRVFDKVLDEFELLNGSRVARCLKVYRSHRPDIALLEDAQACLSELNGKPIYIVTDGNKYVQQVKLQALGLYSSPLVRKCFITRRYGVHSEKPSPYCFQRICSLEKAKPSEVVYIGDNPNKDFVGIKPLGFRTVRIRRGAFAKLDKPEAYEAEFNVNRLTDIRNIFE